MCEPKTLKLYVHMYFVPNYILNLVKSQKLGVTEFYDRLIFSLAQPHTKPYRIFYFSK